MKIEVCSSRYGDKDFEETMSYLHTLLNNLDQQSLRQRFQTCGTLDPDLLIDGFYQEFRNHGAGILAIAIYKSNPIGEANLVLSNRAEQSGNFEAVVHKDYRRKGVSSQLKNQVFGMAPDIGIESILCSIMPGNKVAIASTNMYATRNHLPISIIRKAEDEIKYCIKL